jgi:hypothetical protein
LQLAKETVEDVSVLIGPSDREQAARLRQIMQGIAAEIAVLAQKIAAARQSEKGQP